MFVDDAHIYPNRGVPPDDFTVGDDEGGLAIDVFPCELAVREGSPEAKLFIDHDKIGKKNENNFLTFCVGCRLPH